MVNIKKIIINKAAECVRRLRSPEKYKSLEFFCDYLGADVQMNDKARSVKKMIVTGVRTMKSPFLSKNSICLYYRNPVHGKYTMDDLMMEKEKGAAVFITDKSLDDVPCIITDNPLEIFAKLCRYFRDLSTISVTVVSGSIGKTTVKNMLAAIYTTKFKTTYTKANQNINFDQLFKSLLILRLVIHKRFLISYRLLQCLLFLQLLSFLSS